jgi:hypothetical protein
MTTWTRGVCETNGITIGHLRTGGAKRVAAEAATGQRGVSGRTAGDLPG